MSSRRSDILPGPQRATARPWRATLFANVPLVICLIAVIPIGRMLEDNLDPYYFRMLMLIGFNIILAVSLQLINGFSGQFSLGHAGFMAVGAYLAAYPAIQYSNDLKDPGTSLLFFVSLGISVGIGAVVLWLIFIGLRLSRHLHRSVPGILLVVLLVWIVADFAISARMSRMPVLGVWSHLANGLERLFSAIISGLGPAAAKISRALPEASRQPVCFIILLYGAGCCASAVGFIVGLPALRLRGDYLAIATLGFAEIIRIGIQNSAPLGGALGLTSIPKYTNFAWLYVVVIVTVVTVWRLAYSSKGRAIMAVREDEVAASSIGLNTTTYKVLSFTVGAFFAGVAGGLFSLHERSITPGYFNVIKSIEPVVMVTLGGLGSISGAILAAVVLTLLPELLRALPTILPSLLFWLPPSVERALEINPEGRMVIYSVLLVVMMILRPQGLLGGRELWPRRRGPLRTVAPTEEEVVPA
ncbi:MAG TPA: branched-chain amino acid ABC transporter permease [Tepidisphaeraceae bacterium]|nr:branched-chain amino acid ABC transporter permease [Tepidisphaeraceae bacterium]